MGQIKEELDQVKEELNQCKIQISLRQAKDDELVDEPMGTVNGTNAATHQNEVHSEDTLATNSIHPRRRARRAVPNRRSRRSIGAKQTSMDRQLSITDADSEPKTIVNSDTDLEGEVGLNSTHPISEPGESNVDTEADTENTSSTSDHKEPANRHKRHRPALQIDAIHLYPKTHSNWTMEEGCPDRLVM